MAPMRPLPNGSEAWKLRAGLSYHSAVVGSAAETTGPHASKAAVMVSTLFMGFDLSAVEDDSMSASSPAGWQTASSDAREVGLAGRGRSGGNGRM